MNYWKRQIADPIRGLTLDRLTSQIDAYNNGCLAEFALTAEAMENRDDILKNVITKRKKALTRHGWEILTEDCSDEARAQRDALDYFYRNLRCTHALRPNERGGFQLLVYQMMDAIGKGYAVHEIIWKPVLANISNTGGMSSTNPTCAAANSRGARPDAKCLAPNHTDFLPSSSINSKFKTQNSKLPHLVTASFRFVPLWYFEATQGRLRFLRTQGALHGEEMAERDWLVTLGDALMVACARAFLFKHYPLQAWLDFSQKFGIPGVRGITSAARGTAEFGDMEDALRTFMTDLSVVTNTAESIDVIDLKGAGQPPFSELVERMDRVMASLWRGADLSTLSRDRGYGATLQEQEALVLEQDDARLLSEHLNVTVDRWVLDQLFGPDAPALARIKILVTPQESTPQDLAIDQFLIAHGARLPLAQTLERYGRVQAKHDEPALQINGGNKNGTPAGELESGGMSSASPICAAPPNPAHAVSNNGGATLPRSSGMSPTSAGSSAASNSGGARPGAKRQSLIRTGVLPSSSDTQHSALSTQNLLPLCAPLRPLR
ncbi:MAG TPA: DUF935 family protein [Verrucomicrobiae bacterium]